MFKAKLLQQATSFLDEIVLGSRRVVVFSIPHAEGLPRASWPSSGVIIINFFTTGKSSN